MSFDFLEELKQNKNKPAVNCDQEAHRDKFIKMHMFKVENLKNLNGRLPEADEIFFIWTMNSFNAFTFIPYVIKSAGTIDNLVFSTYSINTRIVNALTRWMESGKIKHIHIFISDSIKYRMPKVVDLLEGLINGSKGKITIKYAWNHSKVTLIQTANHYFVVEGSGNFSENAQIEQYIFMNNKNVFDFRHKWIAND